MKIGLIDVDNYNNLSDCYPNLVLMKLSAWHKKNGDSVEWYEPLFSSHQDIVYKSKVFSFTKDFEYPIDAEKIIQGGSGYAIKLLNNKEVFDKSKNIALDPEIEHFFPDYSLYGITDTAYGFSSRGCPRGCGFCHIQAKEGARSCKVADISEFWNGQKYIKLMDPNLLACKDSEDIINQLIDSKAYVDFNQGLDIRLMTDKKAELLSKVKIQNVHFAWDRFQDSEIIKAKLKAYKEITGFARDKVICYVLCGYDTSMDQNLDRIEYLRSLDFNPYVMLYNKENIPKGNELRKLQRYVNNKRIFWTCKSFKEYLSLN